MVEQQATIHMYALEQQDLTEDLCSVERRAKPFIFYRHGEAPAVYFR